jgi:hypothetical protein
MPSANSTLTGPKGDTGASPVGAWNLLSLTILGSNNTFDVSSISQLYSDLMLVCMLHSPVFVTSLTGLLRFNNDSGNNYSGELLSSVGTTTTSQQLTTPQTAISLGASSVPADNFVTDVFLPLELILWGYSSTLWKKQATFRGYMSYDLAAGDQGIMQGQGFWNSTAAINRIQLLTNGSPNTFKTGSQLRIYGRV